MLANKRLLRWVIWGFGRGGLRGRGSGAEKNNPAGAGLTLTGYSYSLMSDFFLKDLGKVFLSSFKVSTQMELRPYKVSY